jgi:hypothetical protein
VALPMRARFERSAPIRVAFGAAVNQA